MGGESSAQAEAAGSAAAEAPVEQEQQQREAGGSEAYIEFTERGDGVVQVRIDHAVDKALRSPLFVAQPGALSGALARRGCQSLTTSASGNPRKKTKQVADTGAALAASCGTRRRTPRSSARARTLSSHDAFALRPSSAALVSALSAGPSSGSRAPSPPATRTSGKLLIRTRAKLRHAAPLRP